MAFYGMLLMCSIVACASALIPLNASFNSALAASRVSDAYSGVVAVKSFGEAASLSQPNTGAVQYQNWLTVLQSTSIRDGLNISVEPNTILIHEPSIPYVGIYSMRNRD
jgi:hypothetical protein